MTPTKAADHELRAISDILAALDGLDGGSIQRVFDYIFSRLSIASPRHSKSPLPTQLVTSAEPESRSARMPSIRDLKDEKKPESSNQMAAVVAYYLSEVVDGDERKDVIGTADLEKYFKQAGFKLPKQMSMTLPNATAAGYFDAQGNGAYRLNPVGYNLVVHGLPRAHSEQVPRKRKSKAKRAKRG